MWIFGSQKVGLMDFCHYFNVVLHTNHSILENCSIFEILVTGRTQFLTTMSRMKAMASG